MAAMKCILGLLVLVAVSAWTEAGLVKRKSRVLSVSEQMERVNNNLDRNQNGLRIEDDIIVPSTCVGNGCKWPREHDGKVYVPYVISDQYCKDDQKIIKKTMKSFSSTCIRFVPRSTEQDYIHIQPLNGCFSYVGRQGNEQILSLKHPTCIVKGIVQHQLLHALGFHHEHRRSDRDQNIRVLLENVMPGQEVNFEKVDILNQATPYDYNSIMHYSKLTFSKDDKNPTMVAVPKPKTSFGEAKKMSKNDIKRIKLLYCKK